MLNPKFSRPKLNPNNAKEESDHHKLKTEICKHQEQRSRHYRNIIVNYSLGIITIFITIKFIYWLFWQDSSIFQIFIEITNSISNSIKSIGAYAASMKDNKEGVVLIIFLMLLILSPIKYYLSCIKRSYLNIEKLVKDHIKK